MFQLNRHIGVAMLLCAAVACNRGEKQAPAPEQRAVSVQEAAPPPVEAPKPAESAPKAREPAVPETPAAPVLINGVLTNGDAAILADFQKRVAAYVTLKKSVDKKTPDQKETHDPIQIETTQKLLAAKIINVRKGARQGDIFSPDVQTKFRQLLIPEVKGTTGAETKQELNEEFAEEDEDGGNPKAALKVNVEYPEGMPLATTPPNVLQALPKLQDGLEYRFVGRYLLIRDADANIVVDFMPRAIR